MSSEPLRDERRLLRLSEAFELMAVSKSKGYELVSRGEIPGVVDFGPRCKRVKTSVLLRWLKGEQSEGEK